MKVKRWLAILLCIAQVLALLAVPVFAATGTGPQLFTGMPNGVMTVPVFVDGRFGLGSNNATWYNGYVYVEFVPSSSGLYCLEVSGEDGNGTDFVKLCASNGDDIQGGGSDFISSPWTTRIEVNMTAGRIYYFCVPRNGASEVAVTVTANNSNGNNSGGNNSGGNNIPVPDFHLEEKNLPAGVTPMQLTQNAQAIPQTAMSGSGNYEYAFLQLTPQQDGFYFIQVEGRLTAAGQQSHNAVTQIRYYVGIEPNLLSNPCGGDSIENEAGAYVYLKADVTYVFGLEVAAGQVEDLKAYYSDEPVAFNCNLESFAGEDELYFIPEAIVGGHHVGVFYLTNIKCTVPGITVGETGIEYKISGLSQLTEGSSVQFTAEAVLGSMNGNVYSIPVTYQVRIVGAGGPTVTAPAFQDLVQGASYYDAVLWAVDKGITKGTSDTEFSPKADCTRAQIVTFLWRYAGEPEPTSTEHNFVDLVEDSSYYKAVLWAVEKGITNGLDDTHFGPKEPCSRAQIVTFLWRYEGKPTAANRSTKFTDLVEGASYYDAVLWAVEQGITTGADETHFEPVKTCTRAQGVTFLWRYENCK